MDDRIICWICRRKFKNILLLKKHEILSKLHLENTILHPERVPPTRPIETLNFSVVHHVQSWQGLRATNEDRYVVDGLEELGMFFGLYDGHSGVACAEYCQTNIHKNILSCFRSEDSGKGDPISNAIEKAYVMTDDNFLDIAQRSKADDGATAISLILCGQNPFSATVYCANAGDSRAVLCRGGVAMRLSEDHKPSRKDEQKRIKAAGGYVVAAGSIMRVSREPTLMEALEGGHICLAVSRALGDRSLKTPKRLLESRPDIMKIDLMTSADPEDPGMCDDLFIVLACDGIFDVMNDQEVVDIALIHAGDAQTAANEIAKTAFLRQSSDNLTVIVIYFAWQIVRAQRIAQEVATTEDRSLEVDLQDIFTR
eukprot:GHVL01043475.1.p1 GENE.GHVL01043475.1~~GHVL01043475.1.p1  ORF type:complete len:369 (+),score=51.91 GHVL01043475.1:22-1128(+)